jgi:tetratricopeptide (TPR) repeat protein
MRFPRVFVWVFEIGSVKRLGRRIRFLIRDPWFWVPLGMVLMISLVILLAIPRWWPTTPPGFRGPKVRVSGVDLLQAATLAATARREAEAGRHDAALHAWRSATVNNLGDARLHRELLEFLRSSPESPPDDVALALASIGWLLALRDPHPTDLPCIAEVLEIHQRPEAALLLLQKIPEDHDDTIDRIRARCLWSAGRDTEFHRLWQSHAERWHTDPDLVLYHLAWRAASLPAETEESTSAWKQLRIAAEQPGRAGTQAARRRFQAAARSGRLEDLHQALLQLEQRRAASVLHHARYWQALADGGRTVEAQTLARSHSSQTRDPEVFLACLDILRSLGLPDVALHWIEQVPRELAHLPEVWRVHFELLTAEARWLEIRQLTAQLRLQSSSASPLRLEAVLAELKVAIVNRRTRDRDRLTTELGTFDNLTEDPLNRGLDLLGQAGLAAAAIPWLRRQAGPLSRPASFWAQAVVAAEQARDWDALQWALDGLAAVASDHPLIRQSRTGRQLLSGDVPAEAVAETLAAWLREPQSPATRIQHALALLHQGRWAEAEACIAPLDRASLPGEIRANLDLATMEIAAATGRVQDAREAARRVDTRWLWEPQRQRLAVWLSPESSPSPSIPSTLATP